MSPVTTLTVAASHPALEGHFPGVPIVPAVVLLDEMVCALESEGAPRTGWRIGAAKFVKPVRPGELLSLERERLVNGSIRFTVLRDGQPVARGLLVPASLGSQPHATDTG
jgi:3-hydroxyacyl-[acyl-carrier-protein] dehydratase